MTDQQFQKRFKRLKWLGWLALSGILVLAVVASIGEPIGSLSKALIFLSAAFIIPALFYLVALTLWHWKGRYKGEMSDLWGVLLVVETSGWFKIIYLFRHMIPDANRRGRYARPTEVEGN